MPTTFTSHDRGGSPVSLPPDNYTAEGEARITGQAWYLTGDTSLTGFNFSDSPKPREGLGRHVVIEQDGSYRINHCTFTGAGDEALLISNWPGVSRSIDVIVYRCRFDAGTRNAMVALAPVDAESQNNLGAYANTRIRVAFIQCLFEGSFRNPLVRGTQVFLYNCAWMASGYDLFRPPLVGAYPIAAPVLTSGRLYHQHCYGDNPAFELGRSDGASIIEGKPVWNTPAIAELPKPRQDIESLAGHEAYHRDSMPVMDIDEPFTVEPGQLTSEQIGQMGMARTIRFRPGIHSHRTSEPIRLRPSANLFGEPGACLDGGRTERTAIVANDDCVIEDIELKNYNPHDQRAVVEMRTFTTTGPPNGWYEPIATEDRRSNTECRSVYVHDSSGYAFLLSDHTTLDTCRAETMGQGGYTSHGGIGGRVFGGQWRRFNLAGDHNPTHEAGNKVKHHQGLIVEGGWYDDINGTGIWFDIGNVDCEANNVLVTNCTGPGLQFELSPYPCTSVGAWIKRCGRDASPWLNNAAIQIYNAVAHVSEFTVGDSFNGIGFIQDGRTYQTLLNEQLPCPVGGSFTNGKVTDSGQSGWVYNNNDPSGADRIEFSDIEWRLGLSVTPGPYDQWREDNPFRWGDGVMSFEQWVTLHRNQTLIP